MVERSEGPHGRYVDLHMLRWNPQNFLSFSPTESEPALSFVKELWNLTHSSPKGEERPQAQFLRAA